MVMPNRTVAHLSAAEHAQRNLLARGDAISGAQLELAHKKHSQAQASHETSVREYLRKGVPLPSLPLFPSFLPPSSLSSSPLSSTNLFLHFSFSFPCSWRHQQHPNGEDLLFQKGEAGGGSVQKESREGVAGNSVGA